MSRSGSGPLVVVAGASGSGKSKVGTALADELGVPYADGDDFHTEGNRAKMRAGTPLSDDDRGPWLDAIGGWLADHRPGGGAVVSCSALRRSYRDQLRSRAPGAVFCQLLGTQETLAARLNARDGHFMPASLLASQLAALEPLAPDEPGLALDCTRPVESLVAEFVGWLTAEERVPAR